MNIGGVSVFEFEADDAFIVEVSESACHGINFFVFEVGVSVVGGGLYELIFELELEGSLVGPVLIELILIFDGE